MSVVSDLAEEYYQDCFLSSKKMMPEATKCQSSHVTSNMYDGCVNHIHAICIGAFVPMQICRTYFNREIMISHVKCVAWSDKVFSDSVVPRRLLI